MISKKLVAAVSGGAVAGALGISLAGGAFTASAAPATAAAKAPAATKHAAKGHHFGRFNAFGGVLHGQGVVKTKTGYQTLAVDRGTVTAVSGNRVTITSSDKVAQTFTVITGSKVRLDGKTAALSAAKVGDKAGVLATKKGASEYDVRTLVLRDGAAKKAAPKATTSGTGA